VVMAAAVLSPHLQTVGSSQIPMRVIVAPSALNKWLMMERRPPEEKQSP